jgi:hypothetical protein
MPHTRVLGMSLVSISTYRLVGMSSTLLERDHVQAGQGLFWCEAFFSRMLSKAKAAASFYAIQIG